MSTQIGISIAGQEAVEHALDGLSSAMSNLREPFTEIATRVLPAIFARRFDDAGPGWAALSPAYAREKSRSFPGQGILVRTGKMRGAFTDGLAAATTITETSLEFRPPAAVGYWKYHQSGAGRLRARPIVALTEADQQQIVGVVRTYAQTKARAFGFRVDGGG